MHQKPSKMIEKHPLFLKRIAHRIKTDKNGCWVWQGAIDEGYGVISNIEGDKKTHRVHRFVMSLIQHVPKEFVIDHACRNRGCCNPTHLRIVTRRQNTLENSNGNAATNSKKTHCKNGHEFDQKNTYKRKNKNQRRCRLCHNEGERINRRKNLQSTV